MAFASTIVDVTMEMIAQIAFIIIGLIAAHHSSAGRGFAHSPWWTTVIGILVAVLAAGAFFIVQRQGFSFLEKMAERFLPAAAARAAAVDQAIASCMARRAAWARPSLIHFLGWLSSAFGTWLALRLIGSPISFAAAIAIEALLCAARSAAVFVPGAIGIQEAGYAVMMPLFGLPPDVGIAVSLLKRAREIAVGAPVLLSWQIAEGALCGQGRQAAGDRGMKGARVLVTGASGFVGSAVARGAAARGARCARAGAHDQPARTTSPISHARSSKATCAMRPRWPRAMEGVRYLFHVAADYRLWARDPNEIVRNNLEGTRIVMDAARAAGVERIVYTSSVATLKPHDDGTDADESDRADMNSAIGAYKKSKVAAERVVEAHGRRRLAGRDGEPVHAHRPARHPPDADGAHHRGSRDRAHAGLCRYRPQSRPCRRCGRGPSAGAGQGPDRRDLYSGRAERDAERDAGRDRRG